MLFRKLIDRTLALLTIVSFSGVIVLVTIQIISRFAPFSFVWTEELTRYFFLYGICFGSPLALMRNEFINVDIILNRMPDNFRRYYEIFIYLSIILISAVIVVKGYEFILGGHNQSSATLPIQLSAVHAFLMIMGIFLVYYAVLKIIDLVKNKQDYSQHFEEGDN